MLLKDEEMLIVEEEMLILEEVMLILEEDMLIVVDKMLILEEDMLFFHTYDFCLEIEMEKTRFFSLDDPVDKNVYITCFGIEGISLKVEYA